MTTNTPEPRPLYREIAARIQARENCRRMNPPNSEWEDRHGVWLEYVEKNILPSGSGIDCGTTISEDESKPGKIVLLLSYHHMNDGGYYDGWTEHKVIITPSFDGIDMRITGRDRNQIKDYLHDTYHYCLTRKVTIHTEQPQLVS